jgi:hypothetical protein
MLRRETLAVIGAMLLVSLVSSTFPAWADFKKQPGEKTTDCKTAKNFAWIWKAAASPPFVDDATLKWTVGLSDTGGLVVNSLKLEILHRVGCEPGEAGNPNPIVLNTGFVFRASALSGAGQIQHGTHQDIAKYDITVKPEGIDHPLSATIKVDAEHHGKPIPFFASYKNPSNVDVGVFLRPSYRKPDGSIENGPPVGPFFVKAGVHARFQDEIPPTLNNNPLADYVVDVFGSPLTSTTLAFLGDVNGVLSELDLGLATALFTGPGGILFPSLVTETQDLFVAVDLTQWESASPSFAFGDLYTITDGTHPLLPGVLVSNTPISLVPGLGFTSDSPYSGTVSVRGTIDGEVPGPSSVLLFVAGIVALIGRGLFSERPSAALTPEAPATRPSGRPPELTWMRVFQDA